MNHQILLYLIIFYRLVRKNLPIPHNLKFDSILASCPIDRSLSVNGVQYRLPSLQNDVFDILLRYRNFEVVTAGDISKMYRLILVNPEYR